MRFLALTAVAGLALVSGSVSTARSERGQAASCIAARVHYEPGPREDVRGVPWVSAGRRGREIFGYLFYYTPELRATKRLKIYAGGECPGGGSTKILWFVRQAVSPLLTITGDQLDGVATFQEQHRSASAGGSGTVFPSIVVVPNAGCWRLTVRNGGKTARFAVVVVDPA